jgi:hypothetical protein
MSVLDYAFTQAAEVTPLQVFQIESTLTGNSVSLTAIFSGQSNATYTAPITFGSLDGKPFRSDASITFTIPTLAAIEQNSNGEVASISADFGTATVSLFQFQGQTLIYNLTITFPWGTVVNCSPANIDPTTGVIFGSDGNTFITLAIQTIVTNQGP